MEAQALTTAGDSPGAAARAAPVDPVRLLENVYRDFPGLRALILRRARDPELAADILQDAAVTTLEKLRAGAIAHPDGIGGYLYRVALNHLRNHFRKEGTRPSSQEPLEALVDADAVSASDTVARGQWAEVARRTLEELPTARDREVLVRFYLEDEAKDEICSALKLSEAHFNRVVFRARNRFRALLEARGVTRIDALAVLVPVAVLALEVARRVAGS